MANKKISLSNLQQQGGKEPWTDMIRVELQNKAPIEIVHKRNEVISLPASRNSPHITRHETMLNALATSTWMTVKYG